jgi:Peptidase family S41
MKLLITILFCVIVQTVSAQNTFSLYQQQEDFKQLFTDLLTKHPKISTQKDSVIFIALYDSLQKELKEGNSTEQIVDVFGMLVNSIGCGHTIVYPKYKNATSVKALPMRLKYMQGKAVVLSSLPKTIPRGAEIISINQLSILQWMRKLNFFNGGVDNNRPLVKAQAVLDELIYNKSFMYDNANATEIQYLYNGKKDSFTMNFVSIDSMKYILNDFDTDKMFPIYYFNDTITKTMYVKISSFMYDLMHPASAKEMADEMKEEQFDNVIIDLRGNGGGSIKLGQYFLGYFLKESAHVFDTVCMKQGMRSKFNKSIFRRWLFKKQELDFAPTDTWVYARKKDNETNFHGYIPKEESNFSNKKIFVLIDNASFSMAPICAQLLKNSGAVLIGEEAGGRGYLNYAIMVSRNKLKNTEMVYTIPYFKGATFAAKAVNTSKNLMPDFLVEWTMQDVINKKDPCIEKVKELISKKDKQ